MDSQPVVVSQSGAQFVVMPNGVVVAPNPVIISHNAND